MKIWIDLSNSPHALLFEPVVRTLRERGHSVELTARENAQTVELARARWPEVEVIGGESPRRRAAKAAALGLRVAELARWCRAHRPDVAVSHNSYAQIVAAAARRVPAVTAMDFEHQPANHLAFRLARSVLLPEAMRGLDLARTGANAGARCGSTPGSRRRSTSATSSPIRASCERSGSTSDRPRSWWWRARRRAGALYHASENPLFIQALRTVAASRARASSCSRAIPSSARRSRSLKLENLIVPSTAVDSRSLMQAADLVIGAGGTMTREAALLGTRTVTVFAGRTPAVDIWLERRGLLSRLTPPTSCRRSSGPGKRPRIRITCAGAARCSSSTSSPPRRWPDPVIIPAHERSRPIEGAIA